MGVAYYPVFEDGSGGWADDINGKCLAQSADLLERIAKQVGVPGLNHFYSMTRAQMICDLQDGDPDDPSTYDESRIPQEIWHEASAGLRTVRALLDNLSGDCEGTGIREDLQAFERYLADAVGRNVRWHLVVDG
jgi:hypothetical protein